MLAICTKLFAQSCLHTVVTGRIFSSGAHASLTVQREDAAKTFPGHCWHLRCH